MGNKVMKDELAGDKVTGDKIMRDKMMGNKTCNQDGGIHGAGKGNDRKQHTKYGAGKPHMLTTAPNFNGARQNKKSRVMAICIMFICVSICVSTSW